MTRETDLVGHLGLQSSKMDGKNGVGNAYALRQEHADITKLKQFALHWGRALLVSGPYGSYSQSSGGPLLDL